MSATTKKKSAKKAPSQFEQMTAAISRLQKTMDKILLEVRIVPAPPPLRVVEVVEQAPKEASRSPLKGSRPDLPEGAIPLEVIDLADPRLGADCPTVLDWCRANWIKEDFQAFYPGEPWVRPMTKEELYERVMNSPDPELQGELDRELAEEAKHTPTPKMLQRAAKAARKQPILEVAESDQEQALGDLDAGPPTAEDIAAQTEMEEGEADRKELNHAEAAAGVPQTVGAIEEAK